MKGGDERQAAENEAKAKLNRGCICPQEKRKRVLKRRLKSHSRLSGLGGVNEELSNISERIKKIQFDIQRAQRLGHKSKQERLMREYSELVERQSQLEPEGEISSSKASLPYKTTRRWNSSLVAKAYRGPVSLEKKFNYVGDDGLATIGVIEDGASLEDVFSGKFVGFSRKIDERLGCIAIRLSDLRSVGQVPLSSRVVDMNASACVVGKWMQGSGLKNEIVSSYSNSDRRKLTDRAAILSVVHFHKDTEIGSFIRRAVFDSMFRLVYAIEHFPSAIGVAYQYRKHDAAVETLLVEDADVVTKFFDIENLEWQGNIEDDEEELVKENVLKDVSIADLLNAVAGRQSEAMQHADRLEEIAAELKLTKHARVFGLEEGSVSIRKVNKWLGKNKCKEFDDETMRKIVDAMKFLKKHWKVKLLCSVEGETVPCSLQAPKTN